MGDRRMASVPNFFSPSLASWTGYKPYRELLFLSQIAASGTAGEKNLNECIIKRQTHIIWQVGSQRALLLSMAERQKDSFQPALLLAEVT